MSLIQSLTRLFTGVGATLPYAPQITIPPVNLDPLSDITNYRVLRAMYDSNGLYEDLAILMAQQGLWKEALFPLRNPSHQVVEFYASHLWPGASLDEALPIESANTRLEAVVKQIWGWSNFASQKQVGARWHAIYGDLFIKVIGRQDPGRVFFQLLRPEMVTEIDVDDRGYLTHVRIDVPVLRRPIEDGPPVPLTVTEIWDKDRDKFRIWRDHNKGPLTQPLLLGTPLEFGILETTGVNFVPISQAKFQDVGNLRGQGSFAHAFDKITEANRMATRLHQLLFKHNAVTWALGAGGVDANMAPLPAPEIEVDGMVAATSRHGDLDTITLADEKYVRLPGNSTLESLVPDLHYDQALAVLVDHVRELERDLPEMTYSRLAELTALSGVALLRIMSGAIDRATEARGNAEAALIRADQIAISIGQAMRIPGFNIGVFERGELDHTFKKRPIIPSDGLADAQAKLADGQAALVRKQLGVSEQQILSELGYQADDIARMADENAQAQVNIGPALIDQFNRGNTGGGGAQIA